MQSIQLIATPQNAGQTNALGFGSIKFSSPTAPVVAAGDLWLLECAGEAPDVANIGTQMPWDPPTSDGTYQGSTDSSGSITMMGQASAAGDVSKGLGVIIIVG